MLMVAPGFELDVERGPDWLLVRVRGLDQAEEGTSLAEHLWSLMRQHLAHRLVLELDEVKTLDDSRIGQLAELCRRIESHDGMLRLCGLSPDVRKRLHASDLAEHLLPYEDRREAVMAGPRVDRPR